MNRLTVKVPTIYKIWLFSVLAVLWASGILFFIFDTWVIVEGKYGVAKHPLQYLILQIHGASAFIMIFTYGYFLAAHAASSWRANLRRKSGIILACVPAFMMLTGYLIYYGGTGIWREIISYAHLTAGFALPILLIIHIIVAVRNRQQTNNVKILK